MKFKISLRTYKGLNYHIHNENIYEKLNLWYQNKDQEKKCSICDKTFKTTFLPDWVYYGANGNDSICYECPVPELPRKEELIKLIQELIELCGFIPNADFNPINSKFSGRINPHKWVQICEIIFKMGIFGDHSSSTSKVIKNTFGSWLKALVASEVLENNVLKTARGSRCIAKSGNECSSLDEQYIDNWLFHNGYISLKEPKYPKHPNN